MTAVLLLAASFLADKDEPKYLFSFKKADDSAEVKAGKESVTFVVTSKSGIGGVLANLDQGQWPRRVSLRLQHAPNKGFTNLEAFLLQTARFKIAGSLKQSGAMELFFVGPDGKPGELAGKAKVTVDSKDGAIVVTLPDFLLTGTKEVRLEWIDAYR